ncbi:MAG: HD domain-containing protein, partial [Candidatus Dormibacteraeota bacterium]|nr:HD domain-containing protein [Candidatus Dormibacteraeota bacterium]
MSAPPAALRLAEPLAALSLASDLSRGHPQEEALRATSVAMQIAAALQLGPAQMETVYYATLLRYVGCTATSPQYVAMYGASDITVRSRGDYVDLASARDGLRFLYSLTDEVSGPRRAARFVAGLRAARTAGPDAARADCEVGAALMRQFGLPDSVQRAVLHSFERWDGKGWPDGLRGDEVPIETRVASAAFTAVMFAEVDLDVARDTVAARAGSALDPAVARALLANFDCVRVAIDGDAWVAVLAAEPESVRRVHDDELLPIARGFAHAADLKSMFLHGHSSAVADHAAVAATGLGLDAEGTRRVVCGAYMHDIGRVGIDTRTWDRRGPLSVSDWEEVRLHPHHTERILRRAACLHEIAPIAAAHHERPDGGGYHRGLRAADLTREAQLVIACDVFQAVNEDRPHRAAQGASAAAAAVQELGLDGDVVAAVLNAQGMAARRRPDLPAGLSEREVDVLRLLARGMTKEQVGSTLHIAAAT